MAKKKYRNNTGVLRNNGDHAFTAVGRALADRRSSAKVESAVQRVLGKDDTFTDEFRAAFDPDHEHEWILERVHLKKELQAAKKVINAIKRHPGDKDAQAILERMRSKPTNRTKPCFHCPIWRHERELRMIHKATMRYIFPRVSDELYLVTIIFDFVENLDQLEVALLEAHDGLKAAVAHVGRKRHGVMMMGSFEPDLKSLDELQDKPSSRSMLRDLGVVPTEGGGWTLTGHFIVRVPHAEVLRDWLVQRYPWTRGWTRVHFKKIRKDKKLIEQMVKIMTYVGKMPLPLFKPPSRNSKSGERQSADELMRMMSSAFYGSGIPSTSDDQSFDLDAAIVQWAKFVDRMGPDRMYYSVESSHAQKWLSPTELEYVRTTDADMYGNLSFAPPLGDLVRRPTGRQRPAKL